MYSCMFLSVTTHASISKNKTEHRKRRQTENSARPVAGVWRLEIAVISLRLPRDQRKNGFVFWQHRAVRTSVRECVSVVVSFLLRCALAWCLSTNTSLHYSFRWGTQAWNGATRGATPKQRKAKKVVTTEPVCIRQYWFICVGGQKMNMV